MDSNPIAPMKNKSLFRESSDEKTKKHPMETPLPLPGVIFNSE